MSAGSLGSNGGRGSQTQDFELNLASIIDCFTVLITFLLASASFLSIGILDAGVAAAGATSKTDNAPTVHLSVDIQRDLSLVIETEKAGKVLSKESVKPLEGAPDFGALQERLGAIKAKHPDVAGLTLSAQAEVQYEQVVRTMDKARRVVPAVMLGGF